MRNFRALLYYVHIHTYNWMNEKRPRIPIVNFYILLQFNVRRHFCAILSIRVSDSVQPVNCARKYRTKITYHNLHSYTPSCFTHNHTLLYIHTIQHTMTFFVQACHLHPQNCVGYKYFIIYKTTPTHASHVILHFNLQHHFRTRFSWSKNGFHQIGSFFSWSNQKQANSKLNSS